MDIITPPQGDEHTAAQFIFDAGAHPEETVEIAGKMMRAWVQDCSRMNTRTSRSTRRRGTSHKPSRLVYEPKFEVHPIPACWRRN